MKSDHSWHFFRAGGFDQVKLDRGSDLVHLAELDQTLWVALACPTRGIEFDTATLDLIDTDKDGRIRVPEILAAVKWACAMVKNPDELISGAAVLPLASINDSTDEGKQLLASAKQILANLGKGGEGGIAVGDTADTVKIFAATMFNGDGVVPADAAEDDATKGVINDVVACLGGEADRSGKTGVNQAKVDLFFADAAAFAGWQEKGAAEAMPLGASTAAGAAAIKAVAHKVEDYFVRCRMTGFDPRSAAAMNRAVEDYVAVAAKELSLSGGELAAFPIARVEAGRALPLTEGINPGWRAAVDALRVQVVAPLLGEKTSLTETEWSTLVAKFAPYDAWLGTKAGGAVEKLGLARVREILAGDFKAKIDALIAKDRALEPEATAIAAVDKLVRYYRDLHRLLNNFVNFRDFYARKGDAVFQAGRLYMDRRACDLTVRVEDAGRHGLMAHLSRCYLVYCDLMRKGTGEKMAIASAMTAGDSDNLMVGRNGIFYDVKGQDWDATITKIVENPISIRQAFFSPYIRAIRWVEDQMAKRAAAADAASLDRLQTAAVTAENAAKGKEPAAKPKIDIGVVAALGVAVGGITAALGVLLQAFFGLGLLMPLGVVALILLISGPSMILAWLKLRQRNLGPILDANGWAVNARAKVNIPFGRSLTHHGVLPAGSVRDLRDPYREKNLGRKITTVVLVLAAAVSIVWYFGWAEPLLPNVLPKSPYVLRQEAAKAAADKAEAAKLAAASKPATAPASVPATKAGG